METCKSSPNRQGPLGVLTAGKKPATRQLSWSYTTAWLERSNKVFAEKDSTQSFCAPVSPAACAICSQRMALVLHMAPVGPRHQPAPSRSPSRSAVPCLLHLPELLCLSSRWLLALQLHLGLMRPVDGRCLLTSTNSSEVRLWHSHKRRHLILPPLILKGQSSDLQRKSAKKNWNLTVPESHPSTLPSINSALTPHVINHTDTVFFLTLRISFTEFRMGSHRHAINIG